LNAIEITQQHELESRPLEWRSAGTGLCSYRVRGVGGSCAEHLTVESYTITISLQSYLLLLVFHQPLTLSLFLLQILPTAAFPFSPSGFTI